MRSWSDPTVRAAVRAVVAAVRDRLSATDGAGEYDRDQYADAIASEIHRLVRDDVGLLPADLTADQQQSLWTTVRQAALAEVAGLGRLQPLLDDDTVQDIEINGCDQVWVCRDDGRREQVNPIADSDDDLLRLGQEIVSRHDPVGEWNETRPVAEVTLTSGHRVELVCGVTLRPALAIRGLDLSIRRVGQLVGLGTLHEAVADLVAATVRFGGNVLVAGGTGAGKTTTMRCLLNEVAPRERIITIEDVRELALTHTRMVDEAGQPLHPNAVEMFTRRPNAEGAGGYSLSDGLRTAKRMNPDRLVVGEVRSVEAAEMIDGMIGEAGGSICTIHAKSARAAVNRLAYLAAQNSEKTEASARRAIADAVDLVCWQRRDPATGRRWVAEVIAIGGIEAGQLAYHDVCRVDVAGRLTWQGPTDQLRQWLADHGWRPQGSLRVVD